jgi:hypothetical protein
MTTESLEFLARQPAAVDSAFAVLETVARLGPGATARELTEALPMSRASVYRIIKHLVGNEYLIRTPDLRGFVIGERVLALAGPSAVTPGTRTQDSSTSMPGQNATTA